LEPLQATGETFLQTFSGQFEKYDHSAVGKMDIELPQHVKESCFLLKEISSNDEVFTKYCTNGQTGVPYLELQTFLQTLHDYEILGLAQNQVSKVVAKRIFQRISGRWTKNIPVETFVKCLRTVQEYLIFQTLSMMDVEILGAEAESRQRYSS